MVMTIPIVTTIAIAAFNYNHYSNYDSYSNCNWNNNYNHYSNYNYVIKNIMKSFLVWHNKIINSYIWHVFQEFKLKIQNFDCSQMTLGRV
jgi:hypothetical protein